MPKKLNIAIFVFLFSGQFVLGQMSQSLYVFDDLPQTNFENPAIINNAEWTLSLPFLAGASANFYSPVTFNQLGQISKDGLLELELNRLQKNGPSVFSLYQSIDLPLFTYTKTKNKHQYSFALYERQNFSFYSNSDVLDLINNGNSNQSQSPKAGLYFSSYHELSAAYAVKRNRKLNVGIRAKLLLGSYNFQTRKSKLTIRTASDFTTQMFDVNALYNASGINYNNKEKKIESIDRKTILKNHLLAKNIGAAFDFGVSYRIDRFSKINVAFNNIGLIRWSNQTINFKAKGQYQWNGIDLDQVINKQKDFNDIIANTEKQLNNSIIDTITNAAYYSMVNPNILLHYSQNITPQVELSLINHTVLFHNRIKNSFSIIGKYQINKFWAVSSSYSIINHSFFNLGAAVYSNHRKFDWYLGTNNLLWFFSSSNFKAANLTFGCNIKLQNIIDPLYLSWEKKRKMSLKRQENWYHLQ